MVRKNRFPVWIWVFLAGVLWSALSFSLTPQKYCESLAATSCEVLNIEVSFAAAGASNYADPYYMIKYCRNRVFKISPIQGAYTVPNNNYNLRLSDGSAYNRVNAVTTASSTGAITLDNSLCTQSIGGLSALP